MTSLFDIETRGRTRKMTLGSKLASIDPVSGRLRVNTSSARRKLLVSLRPKLIDKQIPDRGK
jgi:hypothetical protein